MYSVGVSEDNLLFSSNFKYSSQNEFAKTRDLYDYQQPQSQQPQPQPPRLQEQQQSSNLARYQSQQPPRQQEQQQISNLAPYPSQQQQQSYQSQEQQQSCDLARYQSPEQPPQHQEQQQSCNLAPHQSQPPQQQSCNLARYRSAPTSFFDSLLNDGVDGGHENDYANRKSMNPEPEMMFPRFNSGWSDARDLKYGMNLKQEMADSVDDDYSVSVAVSEMVYATLEPNNHNTVTSGIPCAENSLLNTSMGMENFNHVKKSSSGNRSNLIRHSSSPAGFLSNLTDEIGFAVARDVGNLRASNGTNVEVSSTTSRLSNHKNFSSGPSSRSSFMPPITENVNENAGTSNRCHGLLGGGQKGDHNNRSYIPSIPSDSTFSSSKRNRDGEVKMFSNSNGLDTRNTSGLLHQLSLPSTSAEMATIESFLHFEQDSLVPCKIRAKRGFATHPRSIAERVRRTRISERIKKLQDLLPNMDKQANTADMLDLAVEYIKDLQKEVETLNETRARCTCSS